MAQAEITIHYGPPGSDRNVRLFESCLQNFDPVTPCFRYLTLTPARRRQLERVFLEHFPAAFEQPVLTLPEFIRRLYGQMCLGRHILGEAEKRLLLEEVLREEGGDLARRLPELSGALPWVSRYISHMKGRNLDSEAMLRLHYQRLGREPGPLESELVSILSRYQRRLGEQQLEDQDGLDRIVFEGLLTGSVKAKEAFPALRRLVLEGFYRLRPVQKGILHLLSMELEEVHFSLDLDSQEKHLDSFTEVCRETLEFLESLGARWVFYPGHGEAPRAVFLQPESREDEVWEVGLRIQHLLGSAPGLDPSQIAVVCSRPAAYRAYIHELFPLFGIPIYWLPPRAVGESRAVGLFLHYVRLVEQDFQQQALFDFLYSPDLDAGLSRSHLRRLERLSLAAGITGGFQDWQSALAAWGDEACQEFLGCLRRLRPETGAGGETRYSFPQWGRLLWNRFAPLLRRAAAAGDGAAQGSARENGFLEVFLEALEKCAAFSTSTPISLSHFALLVERTLARHRAGPQGSEEGVLVGRPTDFLQARFQYLFWLGFAEGLFPETVPAPVIFNDSRSSEGHEGGAPMPDYYAFYILRAAAPYVYYTCSRWDPAPVLPSPFLRYLHLCADGLAGALPVSPSGEAPSSRQENVERGMRAQRLRESAALSSFDGIFESKEVQAIFRQKVFSDRIEVSPSQLEGYLQCGFRYLVRRVLGVEAPPQMQLEMEALEKGDLIHRVLFRYLSERPTHLGDGEEEDGFGGEKSRMAAIAREELSRVPWRDLYWKHQEAKLLRGLESKGEGILLRFMELERERLRSYRVHGLELPLGPVSLGWLEADGQPSELWLAGTVDRVDCRDGKYFLVDYKSGGQDYLRRVFQGWGLQLPLYLVAASKSLGGELEGGGFYYLRFPLQVELKPLKVEKAVLHRIIDYYREKAVAVAEHLYQGHFPVTLLSPEDAGCRSCAYRHICRRDAAKMDRLRSEQALAPRETILERGRWVGVEGAS